MDGHELVSSSPLHRSLLASAYGAEGDGDGGIQFFDKHERPVVVTTLTAGPKRHLADDGGCDESLDEGDEVSPRWKLRLGVVYMGAMAMCSVVLCALGATLDDLAANCGLDALSLSSVYIARGAGAVCGAMASSPVYRFVHGNHALAATLAFLAVVLLALPPTTSPALLHVLFALLGLATSTIDTGVQIMTRKAHGAGAGPWLGANTLAFGVAGAAVPVVSLAAGGRESVVFLVFAAFAGVTGAATLALAVPRRMGEAADGKRAAASQAARRAGGGLGQVLPFAVEGVVAAAAFLVIGGQVALTS